MRLTKTTRHAIRILIVCAEKADMIRVSEIAARLEISDLNAFKIVNIMSRAGLLQATRGRNGGVRLAKAPQDIRIGDVVRVMEQPEMELSEQPGATARRRRQINAMFDGALEAFIAVLNQHCVADLVAGRAGFVGKKLADKPARRTSGSRSSRST